MLVLAGVRVVGEGGWCVVGEEGDGHVGHFFEVGPYGHELGWGSLGDGLKVSMMDCLERR